MGTPLKNKTSHVTYPNGGLEMVTFSLIFFNSLKLEIHAILKIYYIITNYSKFCLRWNRLGLRNDSIINNILHLKNFTQDLLGLGNLSRLDFSRTFRQSLLYLQNCGLVFLKGSAFFVAMLVIESFND